MNSTEKAKQGAQLLKVLKAKLGTQLLASELSLGDAVVHIAPGKAKDFFSLLKLDAELRFDYLVDITVVDWLDQREERFELVYHLMSLTHYYRLRVKIALSEDNPEIDSIVELWAGANFMEREVWDMYGVRFRGHPDLRRILMYDEFEGHPLRKDYPLQAKQPRVKLIAPEVQNTARNMKRPALAQLGAKRSSEKEGQQGDE